MTYLVMFIMHDPGQMDEVLDAWTDAGASGVTILYSTGMARLRQSLSLRDDLPLIPSLADLEQHNETLSRTLLTLVDSEELADRLVAAAQSITGDLNLPNTGILAVLPVAKVYGLNRRNLE
jgi:nitrogen regulatory protein P-II 1